MNIVSVVVTYNRKELLLECVTSILNQSRKISKLVLIDNNSSDGTYEFLKEKGIFDNSVIYYKKLEKNIGGAGGFYEGIKEAQQFEPDWVWIMDDDTIPTDTCLENLIKSIDEIDDKISYLASSIYGEKGEFMNVPTINTERSESGYAGWYKYLSKGFVQIREATFVSLLINNNAVKNIGYPVKDYFIWGDDTEYTLRLNKYYGNSYMIGNSIAIHKRKNSKSLTIFEEDSVNRINFYYYMIRNNLINIKNYYGIRKMIKAFIINQISSLKVLLKFKCKNRLKKFFIIHKALLAFIFKKYDYKAFRNRLDINVKYKN